MKWYHPNLVDFLLEDAKRAHVRNRKLADIKKNTKLYPHFSLTTLTEVQHKLASNFGYRHYNELITAHKKIKSGLPLSVVGVSTFDDSPELAVVFTDYNLSLISSCHMLNFTSKVEGLKPQVNHVFCLKTGDYYNTDTQPHPNVIGRPVHDRLGHLNSYRLKLSNEEYIRLVAYNLDHTNIDQVWDSRLLRTLKLLDLMHQCGGFPSIDGLLLTYDWDMFRITEVILKWIADALDKQNMTVQQLYKVNVQAWIGNSQTPQNKAVRKIIAGWYEHGPLLRAVGKSSNNVKVIRTSEHLAYELMTLFDYRLILSGKDGMNDISLSELREAPEQYTALTDPGRESLIRSLECVTRLLTF
ncbi:hypothetical protein AB6D11_02610 [Vibrio splendidus]